MMVEGRVGKVGLLRGTVEDLLLLLLFVIVVLLIYGVSNSVEVRGCDVDQGKSTYGPFVSLKLCLFLLISFLCLLRLSCVLNGML